MASLGTARARGTFKEGIEVFRFGGVASIGIPLIAVFLQSALPIRIPFLSAFNLPLLVVIFFSVARRSQVAGSITGALVGIFQDALTRQPLGMFGIAHTLVGYACSSISVKVDVENPGSRLLMTYAFFLLDRAVYFFVARNMVQMHLTWSWSQELGHALANALLAVVLFVVLDRFKQRA
jgi:rod shape-determining protein MreD